jgi:V/A-type H+/Na+-transporting ATPase subunit E
MPDTIEAFIGRLQSDGVTAGKQAAEKIEAEAKQHAAQILKDAETQATNIRGQAEADAARHRERVEGELRLAVRDTVLTLRETLGRMLQSVLTADVESHLSDEGFLKELIHEVLRQYAQADSEGRNVIRINLTPEMERQLAHWAVHELRPAIADSGRHIDMRHSLDMAGFEYQVSNGTVQVTTESVVAKLHELARPELRRLLSTSSAADDACNVAAVQAQCGAR